MWVKKTYEYDTDKFQVGDVIDFALTDGEDVQALAVERTMDGMLFCLLDCLNTNYSMNQTSTNEGGYQASSLRKKLNSEILNRFPDAIKRRMTPFENGDLLRPPTEREIFGENQYGEDEPVNVTQWSPMRLRRNRIALSGKNGSTNWYWLQNKRKNSVVSFCVVDDGGAPYFDDARAAYGVRPAFIIQ